MRKRFLYAIAGCLALALAAAAQMGSPTHAAAAPPPQSTALYLPAIANNPTITPTPTTVPTPTPTPTPTPAPEALYVLSAREYWGAEDYYAWLEVVNGRKEQVCSVQVIGKFYDANGAWVATTSGSAMLDALLPQQRSPVYLMVTNAPSTISRSSFTVSGYRNCYRQGRNVTVLNQQIRENSGAEVFGEVRNDNSEALSSVKIVVTFYDVTGSVWTANYGYTYGSSSLAPGQIGVYNVRTSGENLLGRAYTVQAQGAFYRQ